MPCSTSFVETTANLPGFACCTLGTAFGRPTPISIFNTMEQGLTWQALEWADGTRYEGLTKNGIMHSHGVLSFPNKDRYEGQFENGMMHGSGAYVWSNGTLYRGDWSHGRMHGCGTAIWKQQGAGEVSAAEGKFFSNEFVGDVMPCSKEDGYDSAVEADMAAYQARSFLQWRGQPRDKRAQQLQPARQRQPAGSMPSQAQPADRNAAFDGLDQQQQAKLQGLVQQLALQPRTAAS